MGKFYAVEYESGRNTTTGQPNPKTRNYSIASGSCVFASKSERDAWVRDGDQTSAMRGNCREATTLKVLRKLCLGLSLESFRQRIEDMHYSCEHPNIHDRLRRHK